jgi:hypothetical protein
MITDFPRISLEIPSTALKNLDASYPSGWSTSGLRWQAWLNHLCCQTILPWLQETLMPTAQFWPQPAALPSVWEVVNGFAVVGDHYRLVIIPTAAMDFAEFRVPQEWVDLPSWAGDYYLSVYVNSDEQEVEVLGYTTHHQLKRQGQYDAADRTYSLDESELICDIGVLSVARNLCPAETLREELAPLPNLSEQQVANLLERLGDPAVIWPRLAVPFVTWGALLEHGGWRQRLYQKRLGLAEQWSVPQWLQTGISNLAQQFGWGTMDLQPSLVMARSAALDPITILTRPLQIDGQSYELSIVQKPENIWRFELRCTEPDSLIPAGVKLRLLTDDLLPFANNEDVALRPTEQLYLEVQLSSGDGLVWETDPQLDGYDREILRF